MTNNTNQPHTTMKKHNFVLNFSDGSVKNKRGENLNIKLTLEGWKYASYNAIVAQTAKGDLATGDAWYFLIDELIDVLGNEEDAEIDALNRFQCEMMRQIENGQTKGHIFIPELRKYATYEVVTEEQTLKELGY